MKKMTLCFVLVTFFSSCIMSPNGFGQGMNAVGMMPAPGTMVGLTAAFHAAQFKAMIIDPNDPFKFEFVISRGEDPLTPAERKSEYTKIIKYFLASLAIDDKDQWVNLSPYEKDRIIADDFGRTEMGRDLLAQDYLLKQIAASLTNPDSELGRKFWESVYARAYQKFGTTDIETDTFNKVWAVPDKAEIYEKDNMVYLVSSHLKVMLDKDYMAMKSNTAGAGDLADVQGESAHREISEQIMREVIIPAIEKEVNEGRSFAPVRQIYSGMLLATWYKRSLGQGILGKVYADQGKVLGVDQPACRKAGSVCAPNQDIYNKYVESFKKGAVNMIREDMDVYSRTAIPRKYFSGGWEGCGKVNFLHSSTRAAQRDAAEQADGFDNVKVRFDNVDPDTQVLDYSQLSVYTNPLELDQFIKRDGVRRPLTDQELMVLDTIFNVRFKPGAELLSAKGSSRIFIFQPLQGINAFICEEFFYGDTEMERFFGWDQFDATNGDLKLFNDMLDEQDGAWKWSNSSDDIGLEYMIVGPGDHMRVMWNERKLEVTDDLGDIQAFDVPQGIRQVMVGTGPGDADEFHVLLGDDQSVLVFKYDEDRGWYAKSRSLLSKTESRFWSSSLGTGSSGQSVAWNKNVDEMPAVVIPDGVRGHEGPFVQMPMVSAAMIPDNVIEVDLSTVITYIEEMLKEYKTQSRTSPNIMVVRIILGQLFFVDEKTRTVYDIWHHDRSLSNPLSTLEPFANELPDNYRERLIKHSRKVWDDNEDVGVVGVIDGQLEVYSNGEKVDYAEKTGSVGMFQPEKDPVRGGIDMTGQDLDILLRRDGKGMLLPVIDQDLERIRINGLAPVILDIRQMAGVELLNKNK